MFENDDSTNQWISKVIEFKFNNFCYAKIFLPLWRGSGGGALASALASAFALALALASSLNLLTFAPRTPVHLHE